MGTLDNRLKQRNNALDKPRKEQMKETRAEGLPAYKTNGKVEHNLGKAAKIAMIAAACIAAVFAFIYISSFLTKSETSSKNTSYSLNGDLTYIKALSDYGKMHATQDTDSDGLSNSQELQFGTSLRNPDTDRDGVCDYAEIYLNNTDPLTMDDGLVKAVKMQDAQKGNNVNTPYKVHDVVMWPDDYNSRTYGGVVPMPFGYRFIRFNGWAQFPSEGYVYQMTDGMYQLLQYTDTENAWHINGSSNILISQNPIETYNQVSVFGHSTYKPATAIWNILDTILPDKGLISCRKVSVIEDDPAAKDTLTTIFPIEYEVTTDVICGNTHNSLDELQDIYQNINDSKPVLIALLSRDTGLSLVEAYGYTGTGDLYIADPDSHEPIGILSIYMMSGRYMDASGAIVQREWFEYEGGGYNSQYGDLFVPFAVYEEHPEDETTTEPETTTEVETTTEEETTTEPETTTKPEPPKDIPRIKVSFNGNGADQIQFRTQTYTFGKPDQIFDGTIERYGYDMKGWAFDEFATDAAYDVNSPVTDEWISDVYDKYGKSVTLYAVWSEQQTEPEAWSEPEPEPQPDYSYQGGGGGGYYDPYGPDGTTAGYD